MCTTGNDHLDQRDNNLIMLGKSEMDNIVGFIGYLGAFHYIETSFTISFMSNDMVMFTR